MGYIVEADRGKPIYFCLDHVLVRANRIRAGVVVDFDLAEDRQGLQAIDIVPRASGFAG